MIYNFNEPGWVLIVSGDPLDAVIGSAFGSHSKPNAMTVGPIAPNVYGAGIHVYGHIPVTTMRPEKVSVVRAWMNADNADESTPMQINVLGVEEDFRSATYKSQLGAGMQFVELGSFRPKETSATLFAGLFNDEVGNRINEVKGRWTVDDIEIEEVDMKKWDAFNAAITVIKGINGATDGYNADFENRVYSRQLLPSQEPTIKLPYACIPLNQEGERLDYEGMSFTSNWSVTGYAYFQDNPESDPLNSAGAEAAANFRDDLVRAFMADQSLAGWTKDCTVTTIDTAEGSKEDPTTWVLFTIEFLQIGAAVDLEVS